MYYLSFNVFSFFLLFSLSLDLEKGRNMLLSRRTKAILVLSAAIGTAPFICAFSIDPKNFMKAMRGGVRFVLMERSFFPFSRSMLLFL